MAGRTLDLGIKMALPVAEITRYEGLPPFVSHRPWGAGEDGTCGS